MCRYKFNRFCSYYFLDFSVRERLKLWSNLFLNEIIGARRRKIVDAVKLKVANVHVISLSYRKERRTRINEIFETSKIDFEFFDAISPDSVPSHKNFFSKTSFASLTTGSKGCAISHLLLWDKISRLADGTISLIFEDDIILSKQFDIRCLHELPKDLDILYLGCWNKRGRDLDFSVTETLFSAYNPRKGLYAYALTPIAARKLIAGCVPIDIIYGGLDTLIGKIVRKGKIKAYQIIPNLVSVDLSIPSDIYNPSVPEKKLYTDTIK